MDFALTEELQSAQQLAQQILTDFTDTDTLARVEAGDDRFHTELWQALAEAGLLGLALNEAHGGMGFGFHALTLMCEEVGRTVAHVPVIPVLVTAASTLQRYGSIEQQQRLLPGIASGATLVTAALEEIANDDPLAPETRATSVDHGWTLTGTKICAPYAHRANRILVSAHSDNGLLAALVDPQSEGVTLSPQIVTNGDTWYEVSLVNAKVSDADVLAVGVDAVVALQWAQQATRTALCAMAVGLCDKMMRMTGSYTTEREQFGRPVATFQAVSHRMADCYIDIECLRLVTQQAASLLEAKGVAEEAVTVAKIWCGDVTHRVSQAAQHCHGGTGVDRDYPLHRYCLWARQIELSSGSSAQLTAELGKMIEAEYRIA